MFSFMGFAAVFVTISCKGAVKELSEQQQEDEAKFHRIINGLIYSLPSPDLPQA